MILDRHTLNKLFRYCMALSGHHDDAYDLVQDSVEKYLNQKSDVSDHHAFLKRIARNRFFDLQRRKKIVQFDLLEEADTGHLIERDLETQFIDERTLNQVWSKLNSLEKEVVFLWAAEGLSASEIATELNIPRATVLSRLRRLRIRINQHPQFIEEENA